MLQVQRDLYRMQWPVNKLQRKTENVVTSSSETALRWPRPGKDDTSPRLRRVRTAAARNAWRTRDRRESQGQHTVTGHLQEVHMAG